MIRADTVRRSLWCYADTVSNVLKMIPNSAIAPYSLKSSKTIENDRAVLGACVPNLMKACYV